MPVIKPTHTALFSIDEQIHRQAREIASQKTREALLIRPTGEIERVMVPFVETLAIERTRTQRRLDGHVAKALERTPFAISIEEADLEISIRQTKLLGRPLEEPPDW